MESIDGDKAQVFYIDWAQSARVEVENLGLFPDDAWQYGPLIFPCCLMSESNSGINLFYVIYSPEASCGMFSQLLKALLNFSRDYK